MSLCVYVIMYASVFMCMYVYVCVCACICYILYIFPLFLLFYLCFSYTLLFPSSSSSSFQELLNSSLHLLLHGTSLSYSSHYFSGVWLFPLCTLLLWPMWLLCWILGWIRIIKMTVSIKLNEPHPHSD